MGMSNFQVSEGPLTTAFHIPDALSATVLSIAVIGPDERRRSAVASALAQCREGQIQQFKTYPPSLDDVPQMLMRKFNVLIVDLDCDPEFALDLIESICAHGSAIVMVYSEQADPDLMVRCMRVGAREFLRMPLTPSTMAEALVRASARRPATHAPQKTEGALFVFLGSKGGSGVTTLACNFAVSLAQESRQSTLLIDLNHPFGDAAINLGIKAQYSTVDALQNSGRLDASFLLTLIVRHSTGLSVLAAPSEMTTFQASDEAIDRLLAAARQQFDYVVVDAGSRLDLEKTALFSESATVYLVTQIGIAELRNSNRMIGEFSHRGGPKLEVVINRYNPDSPGFAEEYVTKALTRPADWKVPNNYAAVRRMQNTATPLALEDSSLSRTIRQMARGVCGAPEIPEKKKMFALFR
jgi:pilus assembly protein CpaE